METLSQLQRKKQSLEAQNSLGLAQCSTACVRGVVENTEFGAGRVLSLSVHSNIWGLKAPQKVLLALQEPMPLPSHLPGVARLPLHSFTQSTSIPCLP